MFNKKLIQKYNFCHFTMFVFPSCNILSWYNKTIFLHHVMGSMRYVHLGGKCHLPPRVYKNTMHGTNHSVQHLHKYIVLISLDTYCFVLISHHTYYFVLISHNTYCFNTLVKYNKLITHYSRFTRLIPSSMLCYIFTECGHLRGS